MTGLLLWKGWCSHFQTENTRLCVGLGRVVAENPFSGTTPVWLNQPAECNKNNYHLLSACYVPGTMLGVFQAVISLNPHDHPQTQPGRNRRPGAAQEPAQPWG